MDSSPHSCLHLFFRPSISMPFSFFISVPQLIPFSQKLLVISVRSPFSGHQPLVWLLFHRIVIPSWFTSAISSQDRFLLAEKCAVESRDVAFTVNSSRGAINLVIFHGPSRRR